jgi:uncharacterized protein YkwD
VIKAAVVCLLNYERALADLPALREDRRLDRAAQGWTARMVATRQFDHGSDFAARISAAGYTWSSAGENLASGFETPREVVAAWMASAPHCRNILDPNFSAVGTGVVTAPVGQLGGGAATWTEDFAAPLGAAQSGDWGPANTDC